MNVNEESFCYRSIVDANSSLRQSEVLLSKASTDYVISHLFLMKLHERHFLSNLMSANTRCQVKKLYRDLENFNQMPKLFTMYKKLRLAVLER